MKPKMERASFSYWPAGWPALNKHHTNNRGSSLNGRNTGSLNTHDHGTGPFTIFRQFGNRNVGRLTNGAARLYRPYADGTSSWTIVPRRVASKMLGCLVLSHCNEQRSFAVVYGSARVSLVTHLWNRYEPCRLQASWFTLGLSAILQCSYMWSAEE